MMGIRRIALASDAESRDALQVLLKGLTVARPELAKTIGDRAALEALTRDVADLSRLSQPDDAKSVRAVLVQLAEDATGAERVLAAFAARNKLLEPVTTALVLAGIVMLLSTEIDVTHTDVDGKRSTKVHIKKGATSSEILKKFFSLFGVS